MRRRIRIGGALAACLLAPASAALGAQRPPADTSARDSASSPLSCAPKALSVPRLRDTTIRIAVADSHWQRSDFSAGVAFGASGLVHGSEPWNACAGASVHFGSVTIALHNVYGLVRIHTNANALESIGHAAPDSLAHRNGAPPSGPPRR